MCSWMDMARPYVILNAAMTLDGKIATVAGDSMISCGADLDRIHRLRASVDAVIIGVGTVLADNPSLTVRRTRGKNPIRVIVDSEARTPLKAKVFDGLAKTVIAVTNRAPKRRVKGLLGTNAQVILCGSEKVCLPKLLEKLHARGVRKILLEGGSTLNWSMLKHGLVDEVRIAIAPRIVGGTVARTLVGGDGFARVSKSVKLELSSMKWVGEDLLLTYIVKR
jgi:2,5-diamino-6-(ribosylamino)-4(3H)-pyrimidinone 5'-phosphate reductase